MKYKIYYQVKRKGSLANSIKMEINLEADSFDNACDNLRSTISEAEPNAEVLIVQGFEEVFNAEEKIVLPEDL